MSLRFKKALPYLALIAVVIGFVNFFWFFAESVSLGGDGLNGYTRNGHYFVASHGSYTEVSQAAWTWSRIHAASVFITHPLAMAGGAYLLFRFVFPNFMQGLTGQAATDHRSEVIRASGDVLASGRTSGQIGEVRFSGPLLNVWVYPAGVVIKPVFMKAHAILASEIHGVEAKRGVFGRRVEISHAGLDSSSPLILFGSGDSPLVAAIEQISPEPGAGHDPTASATGRVRGSALTTDHQIDRAPVSITATLGILGIAVNIAVVVIGLVWAIPTLGLPGVVWTALAVFIAVTNLRRYFTKR